MIGSLPRWATVVGLLAVLAGLLLAPRGSLAWIASVPVVVLLIGALRPPPKWSGWVAVCMIPYVCIAIAEAVANPQLRSKCLIVAIAAVCVFFAAMYDVRLSGTSLRR